MTSSSVAQLAVAETPVPSARAGAWLEGHGLASIGTADALREIVDRYRKAIALDSIYARAHASIAITTATLSAVELSASAAQFTAISAAANRAADNAFSRDRTQFQQRSGVGDGTTGE